MSNPNVKTRSVATFKFKGYKWDVMERIDRSHVAPQVYYWVKQRGGARIHLSLGLPNRQYEPARVAEYAQNELQLCLKTTRQSLRKDELKGGIEFGQVFTPNKQSERLFAKQMDDSVESALRELAKVGVGGKYKKPYLGKKPLQAAAK